MITLSRFNKDNEKKLGLKLLTLKRTLARKINSSEILRPSYALNGHFENLSSGKIMLFDRTDMSFLSALSKEERLVFFDKLFEAKVSCIIVSKSDTSVPENVIIKAKERDICMFRSDEPATKIIHIVSEYLDFTFAPIENVHGTLVDVWGIGILIVGRSGVGKSEVALDLVERGHRLVADDLVMCRRKNKFILMGEGREFADHYLEIRGVGLVDVKRLYGIRSVRVQKRIEVVLELVDWDPKRNFDRIGIDQNYHIINEVKLPKIELPIFPGKNMTVLAETIALNQLLKVHGINPAKEFNDNLMKQMQKKMKERKQFDEFLDDDYE